MEHPRRREQGFWALSPTSLTVAPWFIGGNSHCPGTARRTSSRHDDVPRETVVHPPLSPLSRHTIDPPDQDMRERGEGSRMERCHHRRPMASSHHPPQCLRCTKARRWPSTSGSTGSPDRQPSLVAVKDRNEFHVKQCRSARPCEVVDAVGGGLAGYGGLGSVVLVELGLVGALALGLADAGGGVGPLEGRGWGLKRSRLLLVWGRQGLGPLDA